MNTPGTPRNLASGPLRAVIYTRVSSDKAGGRSVDEQEQDCRDTCARNNWPVAEVITDNDRSATRYAKKDRPGYRRLWEVLRPGDVLVMWEASRVSRTLKGHIELRELCEERGVLLSYSGRVFDLSEGRDRLVAGIDALIAEQYAETLRDAIIRAHKANLASGKAHGKIPYGYKAIRDPNTGKIIRRDIDPVEAEVIREATRRILAGESQRSISRDFNKRGIPTPAPAKHGWDGQMLKRILLRPSNAGMRSHYGEIVTEGQWEGIIDLATLRKLEAELNDEARSVKSRGVEPKYLLSGIARCEICDNVLYRAKAVGKRKKDGTIPNYDVYVCKDRGHVARSIVKLDAHIERIMLLLLEDPRVVSRLNKTDDEASISAMEHARALRQDMEEKVAAIMDQDLPAHMVGIALKRLEERMMPQIEAAEKRSMESASHPRLQKICGPDARKHWAAMTLEEKRDAIRSALTITVLKSTNRSKVFDPKSVRVEWRV